MYTNRMTENVPADVAGLTRTRWAVLAAMLTDLQDHGVCLPPDLHRELSVTRMLLGSGSLSQGEPQRRLMRLEGRLVSIGYALGTDYLDGWFELLRQAACGEITEDDVRNLPRPRPADVEPVIMAAA